MNRENRPRGLKIFFVNMHINLKTRQHHPNVFINNSLLLRPILRIRLLWMYHNIISQIDKENRRSTKWISKHFGGMKTEPIVPVLSMLLCVSFSIMYSIVPYFSTSVPSTLLSPAYDLLLVVGCAFFIMSLENSILNMIKVWQKQAYPYKCVRERAWYCSYDQLIREFINLHVSIFYQCKFHITALSYV